MEPELATGGVAAAKTEEPPGLTLESPELYINR
jgi:hypothetical protein